MTAMSHHMGVAGEIFMVVTLFLFCFSTFLGVLYYARSNVAYLFGSNWTSQTVYKIFALGMLFMGGLAAHYFVWELSDIGIALMTVFNLLIILPMSGEALKQLKDYERISKAERQARKAVKAEKK